MDSTENSERPLDEWVQRADRLWSPKDIILEPDLVELAGAELFYYDPTTWTATVYGLLPIPGKGASIASDRYHDSMTHNLSSWINRLWNDLKKPTSLPRRPSHLHRRPSRIHRRRTRGWANICSGRGRHC